MNEGARPRSEIYDLGYRPYQGRYVWRGRALLGLMWDDFKRALGAKASGKYKLIVFLLVAAELLIFFFHLLTSQAADLMDPGAIGTFRSPFSAFYGTQTLVLLFMSALFVPQLLCDDRRYRMYPLYLARPIQAYDYILFKGATAFGLLTALTLGPAVLLFAGKAFLAQDALQYVGEHSRDLWALLIAGPLIALFYASFAMALSSLTTSRGYAAAAIIGIAFLSGIVSTLIFAVTQKTWVTLANFDEAVLKVMEWLFFGRLAPVRIPEMVDEAGAVLYRPLSPWIYLAVTVGLIALAWAVVGLSYRREVR